MGNQESISNDKYIIRKKIIDQNINKQKILQQNNQQNNQSNYQLNNQKNNQPNYQLNNQKNNQSNNQLHNKQKSKHINKQNEETKKYENNILNHITNYEEPNKNIEKQNYNNAIVERSMFSDVYMNQNKNNNVVFDYPSNSNNELSDPKTNFDNIKFTPYNFNDEVDKFKKNIDIERDNFEKNEKERRKKFENDEHKKKDYLENQIKYFESNYNPWEILGLEYKDYKIENIKKAYKKNALKYHPDRAGNKYQDKFQLITQSYIYLLNKANEKYELQNKMNKSVENIDYEDNINENVENIYVNKDQFDLNQFNKIFDKYKVPTTFDNGYNDLMKEDIKTNNNEQIFGNNFNKDIFNSQFDNIKKTKKHSYDIIEYNEPNELESSLNTLNQSFLGIDKIDDFGSVNNCNGLSYTDYKKAHVDETLLIDVNKVKYKTYNSIDQLENDRSKISYNASIEDKKRYEYMERKRMEDDNIRIQKQKEYDDMIQNRYNKINQKLIIHK